MSRILLYPAFPVSGVGSVFFPHVLAVVFGATASILLLRVVRVVRSRRNTGIERDQDDGVPGGDCARYTHVPRSMDIKAMTELNSSVEQGPDQIPEGNTLDQGQWPVVTTRATEQTIFSPTRK